MSLFQANVYMDYGYDSYEFEHTKCVSPQTYLTVSN